MRKLIVWYAFLAEGLLLIGGVFEKLSEKIHNFLSVKLNFLKVKFILISIPTIYLSYSYNPVATNTNLRAVTLVYPCSGLNIDSNDITEYRN